MTERDIKNRHEGYLAALKDFDHLATLGKRARQEYARELRDKSMAFVEPEKAIVLESHSPNFYRVPSASIPGQSHLVAKDGSWCDCDGFRARKTCRHTQLVKDLGGNPKKEK